MLTGVLRLESIPFIGDGFISGKAANLRAIKLAVWLTSNSINQFQFIAICLTFNLTMAVGGNT